MITADILKDFRKEMNAAIKEIGKKYNIDGQVGNIKFNDTSFRFKVEMTVVGKTPATQQRKESKIVNEYNFRRNTGIVQGLPEIGSVVIIRGKMFTIEGWNTRSYKNPIELKDEHGTQFKCPVGAIINK